MPFNLRKARSPLNRLRSICPDIRPSDLEGASDEELETLIACLQGKAVKVAIGPGGSLGPSWYEAGPGYDPYSNSSTYSPYSSDTFFNWAPHAGGGTRSKERNEQFPHGENPKSQRSTKNRDYPQSGNYPEDLERKRVKMPMDEFQWEIHYELDHWEDPDKIKNQVSKLKGSVEFSERHVSLVVDSYEEATSIQREWPAATVTRRSRK
jgi:hypothetical protein